MPTNYPDQHTIARRQLLADAQTDARHAAEDLANHHAQTEAIGETVAYGLIVLIVALLVVLLLTPATS